MSKTIHIGVGLSYLAERVRDLRERQNLVVSEGKPLPWLDALVWIHAELKAGKVIVSDCPTPLADGRCPGHQKIEETPANATPRPSEEAWGEKV